MSSAGADSRRQGVQPVVAESDGKTGSSRAGVVSHVSSVSRAEAGRAARKAVPRSSHAEFECASDRPDPVELLEGQAAARASELVPIRYGRMVSSPFAFYRGAALIMASDLAHTGYRVSRSSVWRCAPFQLWCVWLGGAAVDVRRK